MPVAPWSGGPVATVDDARRQAEVIGYPLVIKATAGGGGRGIRLVARSRRAGGRVRQRTRRGGQVLRRPDRLHGAAGARRPPRRGADHRRRARDHVGPRCPRLQHPAPQPEGDRGVALDRPVRRAAARPASGRRAPVRARRLRERRHRRVPLPTGRAAVRLPRGEHPTAGRAPGHRADDRAGPREAAAAHRAGRTPRRTRRPPSSVTPSRRASTPRIRNATSPRHRARSTSSPCPPAPASASTPA